jgi:hypothetical protein
MKRDMDLIRGLLLEVEGEDPKLDLSRWSNPQKAYHAALLIEAGLVKGELFENYYQEEKRAAELHRLTWTGHEFLDAARDEKSWKKVLQKVAKAGGAVTFPILKQMLTNFIKEKVGIKVELPED